MPKGKFSSPRLHLHITEEARETAIASNSGGCLIADAIKRQYPNLTHVSVDMATVRVTDMDKGVRYTYLTPASGQQVLLSFDQGWPNPVAEVTLQRAVHIAPLRERSPQRIERRAIRFAELEEKERQGALLPAEKGALTALRKSPPPKQSGRGKPEVHFDTGSKTPVVHGGMPPAQGPAHPNLLRGRNRHFGAKLADPGFAFTEAVEHAVAARLAEMGDNKSA